MAVLSIREFISSITERGLAISGLLPASDQKYPAIALIELCHILLTSRGEASGIALSQEILSRYRHLEHSEKAIFFDALYYEFSAEAQCVEQAARDYLNDPSPGKLAQLSLAAKPSRIELLMRLNQAPDATWMLVDIRKDILDHLATNPKLEIIDNDFVQLFTSWFNRGFLELRKIDWNTSAVILEKIIQYEAVHGISGWSALRKRLEPPDRLMYGFFHPRLPNEPLVFVEIALMSTMPSSINQILSDTRHEEDADTAGIAVFYSISNCQRGLLGVSLGNFLIKQVVEELQSGLPNLREFVTLSPVPELGRWFRQILDDNDVHLPKEFSGALNKLMANKWCNDKNQSFALKKEILPAAAWFLRHEKNSNQRPVDPVARFHLGNGAQLEQINWAADCSDTALQSSLGIMVNYRYHLDAIERSHEQYAHSGLVISSPDVTRSANKFAKSAHFPDKNNRDGTGS